MCFFKQSAREHKASVEMLKRFCAVQSEKFVKRIGISQHPIEFL